MRRIFTFPNGIVIISGFIAAITVYWQTTRITPLIDYSYQVENAHRMFQGAVPYRDFFLVVAPGTYAVMAMLMKLTGGYSHMGQVYYTMFVACATIILTYRMLILIGVDRMLSALLIVPLIFAGQSIYPYPLYDPNVAITMLVALYVLFVVRQKYPYSQPLFFVAGLLAAIPVFFKQNTGGVFFVSLVSVLLLSVLSVRKKQNIHIFIAFISGGILCIGLVILWLLSHDAFDQFIYQTLVFPSSAKNPIDAVRVIIGQYQGYLSLYAQNRLFVFVILASVAVVGIASKILRHRYNYALIVGVVLAIVGVYLFLTTPPLVLHDGYVLWFWVTLIFVSILFIIAHLIRRNHADDLLVRLSPIVLIASVHATFLSHGIVGSSYHMWPFAILLIGYIEKFINSKKLSLIFLVFLTAILARSVKDNYAMGYIDATGLMARATTGRLAGLSTPGEWIGQFESMIAYVQTSIPMDDRVAFLPGRILSSVSQEEKTLCVFHFFMLEYIRYKRLLLFRNYWIIK